MIRVGDVLYGYCGGYFGESYNDKRVEAIGADWVIAREIDVDAEVALYCGNPEELENYKEKVENDSKLNR